MILIGALIGGITNSLAIKMLFRPHEPIFIRGKRLPFTPGLIPKRRDELANQLGKMVVDHLLTPESIRKKIADDRFQAQLLAYVKNELEQMFKSSLSINDLCKIFQIDHVSVLAEKKLEQYIEHTYESYMETHRSLSLKMVIGEETLHKTVHIIGNVTSDLLDKAANYFASEDGKESIQQMVDDFFSTRSGRLSGMIQMFLGNMDLAEKIQPELMKLLKSDGTQRIVLTVLHKEWNKLLEKDLESFENQLGKGQIVDFLQHHVKKIVDIDDIVNKPIAKIVLPYKETISEKLIPQVLTMVSEAVGNQVESWMDKLGLEQIVREQVASFPVERLEEMVLSISRREFKMITYLGALLGGLIGFVQGVLVLLF